MCVLCVGVVLSFLLLCFCPFCFFSFGLMSPLFSVVLSFPVMSVVFVNFLVVVVFVVLVGVACGCVFLVLGCFCLSADISMRLCKTSCVLHALAE